ncbi:MAG: extracellular solute-binding protein [Bacteroidota bacterium]
MPRLLLALLAALLAAGCGDGRETLVIYSPHGKQLLGAYEDAFEQANPDVNVQWLDMGSQEAFDRVRTEATNPQASLWWGAPQTMFARAAEQDLLDPYTPTWADAVPDGEHDGEHRWYGMYKTPEVIMYNHDAVDSAEAPTAWDDLLDPRFRDRVIIRAPLGSGTMRTIFGAMIQRAASVEDGFRWLARLDENTKTYAANPTQLYLSIARGEGDVTLWNLPDAYLQSRDLGYPFSWVMPAEGTPVLVDAIALVKGGPNPERARDFYEFVTSSEALIDQAEQFHRIPVRTDIDVSDLPEWMRVDIPTMGVDWDVLGERESEWMQRWDENVKGRGAAYLAANPPEAIAAE